MASRSRSIEPKTPCSASVLCGGTRSNGITRMGVLQVSGCLYYRTNVCLFQGPSPRGPPLRIGGESCGFPCGQRSDLPQNTGNFRGTTWGRPSGSLSPDDVDIDADQPAGGQAHRDAVEAFDADGVLQLHVFLGDLEPPLLQRIRNLLRGHGAEETALRAGARLDLQDQARQRLRQVLGLFLLTAAPLLRRPLPRLAVADRPFGRFAGQLPGEEVVPGIPFLHLDQRAGAPQRGNILYKNDFHDSASATPGRGASRSRSGETESSHPT